jgi:hypothetical protein
MCTTTPISERIIVKEELILFERVYVGSNGNRILGK